MKEFFKQLFCKHKYSCIGALDCTFEMKGTIYDVPATFFECVKCKKRIILKDVDCMYTPSLLQQMKLWKKHQIKFYFENEKKEEVKYANNSFSN